MLSNSETSYHKIPYNPPPPHPSLYLCYVLLLGMCPLHMAAWSGKDQIVKSLLENRALVNLPSFSGETPLLLASQHGYANVVINSLLSFRCYAVTTTILRPNGNNHRSTALKFSHICCLVDKSCLIVFKVSRRYMHYDSLFLV